MNSKKSYRHTSLIVTNILGVVVASHFAYYANRDLGSIIQSGTTKIVLTFFLTGLVGFVALQGILETKSVLKSGNSIVIVWRKFRLIHFLLIVSGIAIVLLFEGNNRQPGYFLSYMGLILLNSYVRFNFQEQTISGHGTFDRKEKLKFNRIESIVQDGEEIVLQIPDYKTILNLRRFDSVQKSILLENLARAMEAKQVIA